MYQAASFYVNSQVAQPNESSGATGYKTQPAFVLSSNKAAERNSRRKRDPLHVLETVYSEYSDNSSSNQAVYTGPHGLTAPESSSYSSLDDAQYYDKENMFAALPMQPNCLNKLYNNDYSMYVDNFYHLSCL